MRNMIRQALITNKTLHEKCHDDNAKHRPYNRREPVAEIDNWYFGDDDMRSNVDTSDADEAGPAVYNVF